MTYRFVCYSGDELQVQAECDDVVSFRRILVEVDFENKVNLIPLFNHAYRIVLPNGEELRGLRATRWFEQLF